MSFKPSFVANYLREHSAAPEASGDEQHEPLQGNDATTAGPLEPQTTGREPIPCLPWQLERLVDAASSGLLPPGTVLLLGGFTPNLNAYVLAWAASYLTGSPEALGRLREAYRVWKPEGTN